MQSDFNQLLDNVIGPRLIFHVMECYICGYDEIYYQHPDTQEQIGHACEGCYYVKPFSFQKNIHKQKKTT